MVRTMGSWIWPNESKNYNGLKILLRREEKFRRILNTVSLVNCIWDMYCQSFAGIHESVRKRLSVLWTIPAESKRIDPELMVCPHNEILPQNSPPNQLIYSVYTLYWNNNPTFVNTDFKRISVCVDEISNMPDKVHISFSMHSYSWHFGTRLICIQLMFVVRYQIND